MTSFDREIFIGFIALGILILILCFNIHTAVGYCAGLLVGLLIGAMDD